MSDAASPPGMYLSTLRLVNFRSCYDATIALRPTLTLLVGENNSGKSNVIEALRLATAPLSLRRSRLAFIIEQLTETPSRSPRTSRSTCTSAPVRATPRAGEFDNTLVMVVSDNGASAEGGPTGTTNELQFFNNAPGSLEDSLAKIDDLGGPSTFNHYPWGWTWAGDTPFRRWKRETYRGGTTDPFLLHWPAAIRARGEVRTQCAHIIDLVPTVLDAFGLQPPASIRGVTQSPLHGVSFAHSLDEADPAENRNLAGRHRDKLIELIAMWCAEAGKYDVFPIDASATERLMTERPQIAEPRDHYIYRPHTQTVSFWVGPRVLNRPHSITADAEIPDSGAEGVLICQGSNSGGWTFCIQDGRLHYAHNCVGRAIYRVSAADPLPPDRHQLRFEFEPAGKPDFAEGKGAPGRAQLYLDGQLIANAEFPVTTPIAFNPGGLTCGANPGSAIVGDYQAQAPFPLTGILHTVTVDLSGDLITDTESEMRMAMSRQ